MGRREIDTLITCSHLVHHIHPIHIDVGFCFLMAPGASARCVRSITLHTSVRFNRRRAPPAFSPSPSPSPSPSCSQKLGEPQGAMVTASSAAVGWMAMVLSKSAFVAPIFIATPNPCVCVCVCVCV